MIKLLGLDEKGDIRGKLVVVEGLNQVPFEIKRIFYIYGTEVGAIRGKHANRNSKFAFICMKGSCHVKTNDGKEECEFILDKPSMLLFMDEMVWKEMFNFSEDAVLLVLSNCNYNPDEYIYDLEKFREELSDE